MSLHHIAKNVIECFILRTIDDFFGELADAVIEMPVTQSGQSMRYLLSTTFDGLSLDELAAAVASFCNTLLDQEKSPLHKTPAGLSAAQLTQHKANVEWVCIRLFTHYNTLMMTFAFAKVDRVRDDMTKEGLPCDNFRQLNRYLQANEKRYMGTIVQASDGR